MAGNPAAQKHKATACVAVARSRRGVKLSPAGFGVLPLADQRRILRNRRSAARSREARRAKLVALEMQVELLRQSIARKEAQLLLAAQCLV